MVQGVGWQDEFACNNATKTRESQWVKEVKKGKRF
jgi:hypothetical protein